jgi:transaldolase
MDLPLRERHREMFAEFGIAGLLLHDALKSSRRIIKETLFQSDPALGVENVQRAWRKARRAASKAHGFEKVASGFGNEEGQIIPNQDIVRQDCERFPVSFHRIRDLAGRFLCQPEARQNPARLGLQGAGLLPLRDRGGEIVFELEQFRQPDMNAGFSPRRKVPYGQDLQRLCQAIRCGVEGNGSGRCTARNIQFGSGLRTEPRQGFLKNGKRDIVVAGTNFCVTEQQLKIQPVGEFFHLCLQIQESFAGFPLRHVHLRYAQETTHTVRLDFNNLRETRFGIGEVTLFQVRNGTREGGIRVARILRKGYAGKEQQDRQGGARHIGESEIYCAPIRSATERLLKKEIQEMSRTLLEQLREMTVVVADTGDIEAIEKFKPRDATTNPSLITAAAQMPKYAAIVDETLLAARKELGDSADPSKVANLAFERLAVAFGKRILKIIPGRVSTEVDARLSFDTEATVAKGRSIIAQYEAAGISRERVLIKIASTWEGIKAGEILERDGIHCNLTLLFGLHQAIACAEAGVTLISPFVGRILDWYKKETGRDYPPQEDPGVQSVQTVYNYYKKFGYKTEVMGASFRNIGEIIELAGCDLLTISPALLAQLDSTTGELPRKLDPAKAATMDIKKIHMDRATFDSMHEADRMAKDKLIEGIAGFSKALEDLERLLAKRITELEHAAEPAMA